MDPLRLLDRAAEVPLVPRAISGREWNASIRSEGIMSGRGFGPSRALLLCVHGCNLCCKDRRDIVVVPHLDWTERILAVAARNGVPADTIPASTFLMMCFVHAWANVGRKRRRLFSEPCIVTEVDSIILQL